MTASTEQTVPSARSPTRPDPSTAVILEIPVACAGPCFRVWSLRGVSFKDTAAAAPSRCSFVPLPVQDSGSGRVPRESLDAPENLPKQALSQVAFGKLEDEV